MSRSIAATIALPFLVFCFSLSAQNHRLPLLTATASGSSVRYAGFGEVREMRLEIFDDRGQPLFDSAFTSGNLLDYTLIDNGGARLVDGSYLFIVTIRDFAGGESRKFGTFAIADPRVMLENATPDNLSPAQLAAIGGHAVMPIDRIGIEMPAQLQPTIVIAPAGSERDKPVTPAGAFPRADVAGTGTVNQVTKWTDAMGTLADSAISEVAGRVGIGTTAPGAQLHIFGSAAPDVFAGMGPNVSANGTGFNFGYAGNSFGLGAGFFNVRPAPGAVAPNPSLRFETGNVQRMIVTNIGRVGIGTTNPAQLLDVNGSVKVSGAGTLIFSDNTSMSTAGATLGANTFSGSQTVNGDVTATGTINGVTGSFNDVNGTGVGSFDTVNANTQYNLASQRVLAMPSATTLVIGTDAGTALAGGNSNTFVGGSAGSNTTTGSNNSFFGYGTGNQNISGTGNSFFGANVGQSATGDANSFFGGSAGSGTSTGGSNTFVGNLAGFNNGAGGANAYFGYGSGQNQAGGSSNTYIGGSTGTSSISGNSNTLLGGLADVSNGISNATAIGALAMVTQNDSLVLGSVAGTNFANTTAKVGIGTTAPKTRLQVGLGDVYISGTGTPATGLILRSSDGSACRRLTIDNAGNLILVSLTCP